MGIKPRLEQQYVDPRLVELYDPANGREADTDFYLQLAAELDARLILDLGCGTGLLTRELAIDGRTMIGVDPAPAMLAYAKRQPGAERVQWVEGDSGALGTPNAIGITGRNIKAIQCQDFRFQGGRDWQRAWA